MDKQILVSDFIDQNEQQYRLIASSQSKVIALYADFETIKDAIEHDLATSQAPEANMKHFFVLISTLPEYQLFTSLNGEPLNFDQQHFLRMHGISTMPLLEKPTDSILLTVPSLPSTHPGWQECWTIFRVNHLSYCLNQGITSSVV